MKEFLNTSGSVWRKWDLHVHSPASKLHNEFTSWEEYIEALEKLTDISVIGITDYYSIEGYLKVIEYKRSGRLQNIDLILPNVEMRIDTVTSRERPINVHVIFSPDIIHHVQDKFFRELKYEAGGRTYSCTEEDLIELGRATRSQSLSKEEALREGMNQFKVSIEKLEDVFHTNRSIFAGKYITVVANKSSDGASGIRESSMEMEQRKIYRFADAIFSSRPKDREFFLGEAESHPKEVIIEKFGSLKPCIHGSDAHNLEKLCKPDLNRFTWIKAEPSFEGLLQIIHEPKDRVIIQEEHPDSKSDYNVIQSVKFIGNENFSEREIKLNPGLNTIIGGKSSGKSLLLYKIAQAISSEEVNYREKEGFWKNPYKNSFIENVDFEVTWRNGNVSNSKCNVGKVTYIPQMYINSLSEDTSNTDLQKKITEILMQNPEYNAFLTNQREEIRHYNGEVSRNIVRLFEKLNDLNQVNENIKRVGDKNAILQEKEKIQKLIEEKIKVSNLTETEEEDMKNLQAEKEELSRKLTLEALAFQKANRVSKELEVLADGINKTIKDLYVDLKEEYLSILDELRTSINQAFVKALVDFNKKFNEYALWEKETKITEETLSMKLEPYHNKLKGLADITELRKRLDEQKRLLEELEGHENTKGDLSKAIDSIKNLIRNNYSKGFEKLMEVKGFFSDKGGLGDIQLIARIEFDHSKFEESFLALFNRRGRIEGIFPGSEEQKIFDENDRFIFGEETYLTKLFFIFEHLLKTDENNLKLRKSFNKQQAVEHLLSSSFIKVIFDLYKDGDYLSQMSPGKRGLVLLELFLGMSEEKHPILIDQPEDNLDNRTISKDLVEFIRMKKNDRQIIIVTHNANLVVLTDAENVIVANQDSQLKENETNRFEYINGALECDFISEDNTKITGKGIKSHVCEILEGGQEAFEIRERKYGF